ncbi:MAG: molybdopterin-dependent oxidoreductase [Mogibacterium sp.]|nr:molybdopterin-dependent oxidoreductase [Mogibacterium sp.]
MNMKDQTYIGKNTGCDNALDKVTGKLQFCADLAVAGTLHMRFRGSEIAHGRLLSVDTSRAERMPGVRAVYTCFNTPNRSFDRGRVVRYESVTYQEKLFDPHIRFYGERIAAVVAETAEQAEAACRAITAEYEVLPAAVTPEAAMAEDAPQIHKGGNCYISGGIHRGDYEHCSADRTFRSRAHLGRMTHLSMETQTAKASYDRGRDQLTVWTGCQTAFGVRATVADLLGIPYARVRVIKTQMGGSFGCKQETVVEPLAAYAAYDLCAEVLVSYSREEQINNCILKHNVDFDVESKVDEDGTIRGVRIRAVLDAGAYTTVSHWYIDEIGSKSGKVYRIPDLTFEGVAVNTNTAVNGSFRSWGSGEIAAAYETHWDLVCRELGLDPVEFRLKNVRKPYEEDIVERMTVGRTHFEECLIRGRERFGWEERRARCRERNASQDRYRYGVGMAVASHTSSCYPHHIDLGAATARLEEDGSVTIHLAVHDHGCGAVTALRKIAAEALGIDLRRIVLEEADTMRDRYDYGCFASRTVYVLGQGIRAVCGELIDVCRWIAADRFGCDPSAVRYEDGLLLHGGEQMDLGETACYSLKTLEMDVFARSAIRSQQNPGVPCAHFCEVRVDTYSGLVEILHCLSVHDIGRAINPDMVRGQIGSGIQQGMGIALCEEVKIDPKTGRTLTTDLRHYDAANSVDLPEYDVLLIEDGDDFGPFGAKSIGEACVAPVAPAIAAAVNDALGTRLSDLPLTPAKILEALER